DSERSLLATANPKVIQVPEFGCCKLAVVCALKQDGMMLQYAHRVLRADGQVIKAAIQQNPAALRFALGPQRAVLEAEMASRKQESALTGRPTATKATLIPWKGGSKAGQSHSICCFCETEPLRRKQDQL
ncbi:unnamed protein product, partial [Polarella glacialis]